MALKLTEKLHVVDNVWSFRFSSDTPFDWTAGQFVQVELPHDKPDGEGTKRWFTVSSAPFEGALQITTRVTGTTFKQALAALPVGGELTLVDPPDGDFVWEDTDKPKVFVAGGIGVTPFHSILKQRAHDHAPLDVSLVCAGRTADLPFKDEVDQWTKSDPHLRVHYVIAQPLSAKSLAVLEPDLMSSLVYVSGPEPMVETLGDQLRAAGLPEAQIKQDFFPNYTEANY